MDNKAQLVYCAELLSAAYVSQEIKAKIEKRRKNTYAFTHLPHTGLYSLLSTSARNSSASTCEVPASCCFVQPMRGRL